MSKAAFLNVLELGPGNAQGPPIVLLHGAGANLLDLKVSLGERLARDRRVIMIDRPGHGWSHRTARADISTPEGQAIVLNEALGKLGVERPLVVGHDWGGAMALAYALSYPEEVSGLVTIAPLSHHSTRRHGLAHRLAAARFTGRLASEILVSTVAPLAQRVALRRSFSPQAVPADYADAVAQSLGLRPAAFAYNARDIMALDDFLDEQSSYYGQISVPVVVITGDEDAVARPVAHAERLAHAVSDSRLVVLNDVGHMAHHASPNVIVFEINRLAERL